MSIENNIIKSLLEIKAIEVRKDKENWFTWTSGIKSPIYCDNRLTISYPRVRNEIALAFKELIDTNFKDVEVIAGTATAGIPHAAWVSSLMNLPMVYVRNSSKQHGKTNQIEGLITKGSNVVIIEDLISTGKSSINVARCLREHGVNVVGIVAIFSYNLEIAKDAFMQENIKLFTLSNYDELIDYMNEINQLNSNENQLLIDWRNSLNNK